MLSIYKSIRLAKPDPILGLSAAFLRDPSPSKINLGVGAYRDNNGNPWTLPSVALAEGSLGTFTWQPRVRAHLGVTEVH
ncbi:unnamed protein product [Pichia kudriavzevii]